MKSLGHYIAYDKQRQGIYTDLDSLYDTRLACIEQLDSELAKELLEGGWNSRINDKIQGIDQTLYEELYSLRSEETLELAVPTYVKDAIGSWILQAKSAMDGTPFGGYCEVFVNVFPYRLSKTKAQEIAKSISKAYPDDTRVRAINIHPHLITPSDVRRLFSAMFMIDWMPWLEHFAQEGDLKKIPLADVSLIVPKLMRGQGSIEEYHRMSKIDYFSQVEASMQPLIGLQFLDTDIFSAVMDKEMLEMIDQVKKQDA